MNNLEFIGCIFARGGSKGIPNKNIKMFNGKPLIAWSIDHAKKVKKLKRIIVSTDSKKIAKVAEKYGAEVPFIRPKKLATDTSPEWYSWQHLVNYLASNNSQPNAIVSIPTSSPLRSYIDIEDCIKKYKSGKFDAVITATKSKRSPYFNIVKKNKNGFIDLFKKINLHVPNRQKAPVTYDLTTVCYVVSTKFIKKKKKLFSGKIGIVEIPEERSVDIDTLWDFKIASLINSNLKK